ncbi:MULTISPECIES: FAD-binding oxidoreductase [unclassified Spirosoma]|uniref:FAD-binding oxidoreductase n=1 Tax=unclassified Spirosoma TaxID=2621999 RepID=UPI00095D0F9B|nr:MULTISPECIES: FAD-binding oxidoreductase [unclassified Spirosoma]MBN8825458.1 FAD-binding oxidoreductase [Spirosoma sp.]OJW74968.1 MAG: FAD-binding oxidoreductase [Spirosoma sp. 48-14]
MSDIVELLVNTFGRNTVLSREEASSRVASHWKQTGSLNCRALLLPTTTQEVSRMLQICHEFHQPVVPQAGLTNVVGGTDTNAHEIALSLERMNQVEQIDVVNKTVTVQAGVVLQQLRDQVAAHGQLFPLDLGAKGSCMIGGNIASNAGGLQALRYGVMRNLVLGLEVVLADGTIVSSMNKMMKNNAGYDLKQLFIGSEGTLGIITRAVLKLDDMPKTRNTAFIAVDSFEKANALLLAAKTHLKNDLTSFELLWQDYYQLMTSKPALFAPPLAQHYPFYVLLESLGQDADRDKQQFEAFLEQCLTTDLIVDAVIAQSQKELDWFWGIRENVEFIFSVHRPVFLFDISLAISEMDAYIKTIRLALQQTWPDVYLYTFGHMGDGNLHLFISCGHDDHTTKHSIEEILYTRLQPIGGSITGEHGIGLEKKTWLYLSRTPEEIALMRTLKKALDPRGILNPGKLVPD